MKYRNWLCGALALFGIGCSSDDTDTPSKTKWHVVSEELPGALFSVTGSAADDVWVVGAERAEDAGPTILHFDGDEWQVFDSGVTDVTLVWVHALDDGTVYAGGTDGTLLRYTGDDFEKIDTPDTRNVWGVWGKSADDLWVVGGDPNTGGLGFVWRDRGDGLEEVELGDELPSPAAWYKVWGRARNDIWFCGVAGALMHFDGEGFEAVDAATDRDLLTVHGRADGSLLTAVGGQFSATLVSSENEGNWRDVTPEGPPLQTFGVFHRGEEAYSVGMQTTVLHHDGAEWREETTGLDVREDFHAVWIDPDGGVWAVGGEITSPPFDEGTLIYKGELELPPIPL